MRYNFKAGMLLKRKEVGGRRYVIAGEEDVPGVRIQKSGVRTKSICSPPTAYCRLPTAVVGGRRYVVGGEEQVPSGRIQESE
jgi:hypothetical protein